MMNKTLKMISFFAVSGFMAVSDASWKEGYYAAVTGGYSKVSGKLKPSNQLMLSGQNRGSIANVDAAKGSYVAGAHFGHRATFGRRHFSAELGVFYNNASAKVGELTAVGNHASLGLVNGTKYSLYYKPRFGAGASIRVGYLFMPEVLGYVRMGLDHAIGQYLLKAGKNTTVGANVTSLVAGLGVEGQLKEKLYWRAGVDYKLSIKASKKESLGFSQRPKELVGQVGLGYSL